MIEKSDTFYLVSNYNTDPEYITQFANDFLICDQSDKYDYETLKNKYGPRVTKTLHSGHNLSDYFWFFAEYYEKLPNNLALVKSNLVPRHITETDFLKVYNNSTYTLLNSAISNNNTRICFQPFKSFYAELNNDWYVFSKTHTYFTEYDKLLMFIYKDPVLPKYNVFSPGGCYIISSDYVLKYPRAFWENLYELVTYTFFPAEAYHVERMLNLIFLGNYEIHEYMKERESFGEALKKAEINRKFCLKLRAKKFMAKLRK